ncbi:UNVERIFIED_ORG: Flp family type IVb pilin [Roseateles sp. XES5]|nr:Flp family type IVb pilin [Roseateles sp. XES5]
MMTRLLKSFLSGKSGATAVEYGLLAALISVGLIAGASTFGNSLNNTFMTVSNSMQQTP